MRKILFRIFLLWIFTCLFFDVYADNKTYYNQLFNSYKEEYINKNYSKSLEYLLEMKQMAEKNNWKDAQMYVLSDIGLLYTNIFEYDKAMQCYLESYDIAISIKNKEGEVIVLNNIGWQYSLEGNYEKSKEYVMKAYNIAVSINDSLRIGQMAMNLADSYQESSHRAIDSAEKYIDIALDMLKNQDNPIGMPHAVAIKMENLYLREKYKEAEVLALNYLKIFPELLIDDIKARFFLVLSKIYYKQENIQEALYYAHQALNAVPALTNIAGVYSHLSDLYKNENNFPLSLLYKDSAMIVKDSLVKINEMDRIINNQIRTDLLSSEKKLIKNQLKQQTDRRLFTFLIIFIFILACVIIWILRIQSVKNKQGKIISENQRQIAELELDKEKNRQRLLEQQLKEQETMSLLEQEKLNNEIEAKNRQLTAKVLFQTNRNKLIDEIIGVFLQNPELMESPTIKSLYQQLKMERQESVNNGFLVYFEQLNPAFLSSLKEKHSGLTANDIRMLSYIYLNLSSKEIANLLNVLPDSLKKKKQRLATKLGIDTTELYNYLTNIEK